MATDYGAGFLSDPTPTTLSDTTFGTSYTIKYYNYGTAYILTFPLVPAGNDPTKYGRG